MVNMPLMYALFFINDLLKNNFVRDTTEHQLYLKAIKIITL